MGKGRIELRNFRAHGFASTARVLAGGMALTVAHVVFAAAPGWHTSFEQALEVARQQKKPIFVDFSTSWCGVCKQMDRSTLADPSIIQRLDSFVAVKVDGDARQDLCSRYGVAAYPTFINLDPNGRIIEKREGFMRVQDLASTLDRTYQMIAASNTAVAQAAPQAGQQQQRTAAEPAQPGNGMTIATAQANNHLLSAPGTQPELNTRTAARETGSDSPASESAAFNSNDPRLQGSVYAMGASPTSDRRSRFGGSTTGQTALRELAEATADPTAIEQSENSENDAAENADVSEASENKSDGAEKTTVASKTETKEDSKKAEEAAEDEKKVIAETTAKLEADKKALESKPKTVASASPSPVIESRLKGLSEADLPKPLLSRTISGPGAQPVIQTVSNNVTPGGGDPLATIRRIQKDSPAEPAAEPKVSQKSQPIAAEKPAPKAEEKSKEEPAKEVAAAVPDKKAAAESSSSSEEKSKADPDKAKVKDEPKTEEGASKSDIERWMTEADKKLVSDKKKEARAMYAKVVDNDPKNKFGKSDVAYVRMVSLIVDSDSDLLRRQAYNKIKEFEARYPKSENKDYYTLIRAILAADLGESNEAHRLLGSFPERFPDSKYIKKAHEVWKDLPPVKKESTASKSSKSSRSSASSSSKRSSNDG